MLGICDEQNSEELLIPALRALACVLTLARFHVHTSETLSLLKNHIWQFGQLAKVCLNLLSIAICKLNPLIRKFVNLKLIGTSKSSHLTGQKCILLHTLLRASAGGVSSQAVVLTVERPSTPKTGRTIVGQTDRHLPKSRLVIFIFIFPLC